MNLRLLLHRLRCRYYSPRIAFLLLTIIFVVACLLYLPTTPRSKRPLKVMVVGGDDGSRRNAQNDNNTLSSSIGTCRIPRLEIDNSEIIGFFKPHEPLPCDKEKNWAYVDGNGKFELIGEKKDAECWVAELIRVHDDNNEYGDEQKIVEGDELPADAVKVRCKQSFWTTWKGLLHTIKPLKEKLSSPRRPRNEGIGSLSVLMLSFDSLSQMTFRRKLPETIRVLEKELEAVVLNGYNIVGDGTPQAWIPILTGKTEEELPMARNRFAEARFLNEIYPFVWNNFSETGYVTMFAEDQTKSGMFTYRLKGFDKPPTDHYSRAFHHEVEYVQGTWTARCVGSEPQHTSWLRYAREFLQGYKSIPRFGVMHNGGYSHDDINMIGNMDGDFAEWLRGAQKDGVLDDVVLIVMADHGARFSALRETHQGQMEERLPFFSVTLPRRFRDSEEGRKILENLKMNRDRLSTPFDVHSTLLDIISPPKDWSTEQKTTTRSLSLFRPIPASRTCDQAGIPVHFCTCLNWRNALLGEEDIELSKELTLGVVSALRAETLHERASCAPLSLRSLEYAKKLVPNESVLKYRNVLDKDGYVPDLTGETEASLVHYQFKFATRPGRGVYEVTVVYRANERTLSVDLASVSHVSQYGDFPHCVIDRNYFLAKYCVCRDRIGSEKFVEYEGK